MNSKLKYQLIFTCFFTLIGSLSAQVGKADLQRQNQALQKAIRALTEQIAVTKRKSHSSLSIIQHLERKIDLRAQLIHNKYREISILERRMESNGKTVSRLNQDLKRLRSQYAAFIRKSYETRSNYSKWMFLLASDNFLQAYKRLSYIRQYAAFRKRQSDEIRASRAEIETSTQKIKAQRREKKDLLAQAKGERKKWQAETAEQKKRLAELKSKERTLLAEVSRKQSQKRQLDRQIKRIIEREIRMAKARAKRERAKKSTGARSNLPATAETAMHSASFTANKNKLPWPVTRGKLISKFGRQPYPGLNGIYVENSGVEIATSRGAEARAVFKGVVSSIYAVPGGSQAILIKHGDYYTLYNNLDQTFVQKGDRVNTKQRIGHVYTNPKTDQTVLEFQIWKKTQKLDPQSWIYKM